MVAVPTECASLRIIFAPLVSQRVWQQVPVLVGGAMLAPGKRPITAALRAKGLAHAKPLRQGQRVLTRAVWSRRERPCSS
jgi:hypothetical protein